LGQEAELELGVGDLESFFEKNQKKKFGVITGNFVVTYSPFPRPLHLLIHLINNPSSRSSAFNQPHLIIQRPV
jgi:hypothetical protein